MMKTIVDELMPEIGQDEIQGHIDFWNAWHLDPLPSGTFREVEQLQRLATECVAESDWTQLRYVTCLAQWKLSHE